MDNLARNNVDNVYLNLLKDILINGVEKETRSGKVKSVFGRQIRFNLKEGFPLLTTKRVFYRGVIEELLWFLSGNTNIYPLVSKNVHIWDDDAFRFYKSISKDSEEQLKTKEEFIKAVLEKEKYVFLNKENNNEALLYQAGDLGPVYGKQWRSFGDVHPIDQIANIINTLKENPNDRRMLCVAFNPSDLNKMALPPCHVMFQFYTRKLSDGKIGLSCMWTQRSVDVPCGLPFNIASYAALTYMIAEVVGMVPDELIGNLGDTHIYLNQIDGVNEQLSRKGFSTLPTLTFNKKINNIDDFKFEDFNIENYQYDPPIKYTLNVG